MEKWKIVKKEYCNEVTYSVQTTSYCVKKLTFFKSLFTENEVQIINDLLTSYDYSNWIIAEAIINKSFELTIDMYD